MSGSKLLRREERLRQNADARALAARAEAGQLLSTDQRQWLVETYTGLGGLSETAHTGLAGLAEARERDLAQFFTPPAVGSLAAELLAIPGGATVFDPAIGTGRMLFELQDWARITGIEVEADAFSVCRAALPDAAVIQDDLIDHMVDETFDYVLGNPPFSLTLTDTRRRYVNTNWEGRILSHVAWLELAVRSVKAGGFIGVVLPADMFRRADTLTFHRWLNDRARVIAHIGLPADTFLATDWPCVLTLFQKRPEDGSLAAFKYDLPSLDEDQATVLHEAWHRHVKQSPSITIDAYARSGEYASVPLRLQPSSTAVPGTSPATKSLPLLLHDEVRVIPRARVRLKPTGLIAALALEEVRLAAPERFERKRKEHVNEWDELVRKPFLLHHEDISSALAAAGLDLWMSDADARALARQRRWLERELAPLERAALIGGDWQRLYEDEGITHRHAVEFARWLARARRLGLHELLHPYQLVDCCRIAMKRSVLLALQQGLGKTRVAICAQILVDAHRGLYGVPSKLIGEWENEFRALALPVHVVDSLAATRRLSRFNLVAFEALWRIPRDSPHAGLDEPVVIDDDDEEEGRSVRHLKHTLATALRRRCSYVVIDEGYYIKNPSALRTRAVYHLKAKRKVLLTGTPIKGYPQNILALLNWGFGSGSARLPDYSYHEEGGVQRFLETFGSYVYYDEQHRKTGDKGRKKQIPRIANVEQFYDLLKPKMIRRVKGEPEVRAVIPVEDPAVEFVPLSIEGDHRRFYQAWLTDFVRWYQARLEEQHLGGKRLGKMEILAKLGYLIQAATIPQSENLSGASTHIAPYAGGPTTLQAWVLRRVREAIAAGEKVIVFSRFLESLAFLQEHLRDLHPIVITGSVSLTRKKRTGKSARQELVEAFRRGPTPVLLAGTTCLSEGMNIPEACVGIFCDYDWTPSVMFQALYRMVRPQQKRLVRGYFLTLAGTIMEYQQLICELKQKAIDEGIDFAENDFDLADVPDIEQYCQAIVDAGGHVPPKRLMHLANPNDHEEVTGDLDQRDNPDSQAVSGV